jgi:hypothetical protein
MNLCQIYNNILIQNNNYSKKLALQWKLELVVRAPHQGTKSYMWNLAVVAVCMVTQ